MMGLVSFAAKVRENPIRVIIDRRDARAPREGAAWERGRPARILGLRDELPYYDFKVFCQTLTS
jgi:hypothetical protein